MNELTIPLLLAAVAAWDIGRRYVRAKSAGYAEGSELKRLHAELIESQKAAAAHAAAVDQRCTVAEQHVRDVKNRVEAAAAAASNAKARGWSQGRPVKLG